MGISRYTTFVIQGGDARAESLPCKDGKYQDMVNIYRDGFFHTTILSTQESFYDSHEGMQEIIDLVNKTDLTQEFLDKQNTSERAMEVAKEYVGKHNKNLRDKNG